MKRFAERLPVVTMLALLAACDKAPAGPSLGPPKVESASTPAVAAEGTSGDPDMISFMPPGGWIKEEPSNNLRKAQYRVPDKNKGPETAELVLFYFGDSDAMIEQNIQRWTQQMGRADASPETIQGRSKITLVDIAGNYRNDFGSSVPDARMLAAVVETPRGPWYFKMVGPAGVVAGWRDEFIQMVQGAHR